MGVLRNPNHELYAQHRAMGYTKVDAYMHAGHDCTRDQAYKYVNRVDKNPEIKARIVEIMSSAAEEAGITAFGILSQLKLIGYANLDDFMIEGEDGAVRIDITSSSRAQRTALQEVLTKEFKTGRGEGAGIVTETRVKLHDKVSALVKMGESIGLFKNKVEISGPGGGPVRTVLTVATAEEAAQLYASLVQE